MISKRLIWCGLILVLSINCAQIEDEIEDQYNTVTHDQDCAPTGPHCNEKLNLTCTVDHRCKCREKLVHVGDDIECLEVAKESNGWLCQYNDQCTKGDSEIYSYCTDLSPPGSSKKQGICVGFGFPCKSDEDCEEFVNKSICISPISSRSSATSPICECPEMHGYQKESKACVEVSTINSPCQSNRECQHEEALGPLSICHGIGGVGYRTCVCWDIQLETKFKNGKCHYSRRINETCNDSLECELGAQKHETLECLPHPSYNGEKTCQMLESVQGSHPQYGNSAMELALLDTISLLATLLPILYY